MKKAFSKVFSAILKFWRYLSGTFVKRHIYIKDVDADGVQELVIDPNGNLKKEENIKEENNYDK